MKQYIIAWILFLYNDLQWVKYLVRNLLAHKTLFVWKLIKYKSSNIPNTKYYTYICRYPKQQQTKIVWLLSKVTGMWCKRKNNLGREIEPADALKF